MSILCSATVDVIDAPPAHGKGLGKFKVEVKLLLDRLKLLTGVPATVKLMPCVFGMFKTVA